MTAPDNTHAAPPQATPRPRVMLEIMALLNFGIAFREDAKQVLPFRPHFADMSEVEHQAVLDYFPEAEATS